MTDGVVCGDTRDPAQLFEAIIRRLRGRHPRDAWIFATEVETTTGALFDLHDPAEKLRRIDAFAMGLWPSQNYKRVAYEIKVSRADWLSELKDPTKRVVAFLLSNEFWFVLGPGVWEQKDMNRDLFSCGVLVLGDDRLITKWKAKWHPAFPLPNDFVASLLRRVREQANNGLLAEEHLAGVPALLVEE